MVSILLEPWRAGESVATLSSETAPRAWAYKRVKLFLAFLDDKSVQFGMILLADEGYLCMS